MDPRPSAPLKGLHGPWTPLVALPQAGHLEHNHGQHYHAPHLGCPTSSSLGPCEADTIIIRTLPRGKPRHKRGSKSSLGPVWENSNPRLAFTTHSTSQEQNPKRLGTPQLGWAPHEVLGTCRPADHPTIPDSPGCPGEAEPHRAQTHPGNCTVPVASPSSPGIPALPCAGRMAGPAKGLCTEHKAKGAPGQWGPQDCNENSALRFVQCTTCTPTVVA